MAAIRPRIPVIIIITCLTFITGVIRGEIVTQEFETKCGQNTKLSAVPDATLPHATKIECATRCLMSANCTGFNYDTTLTSCDLFSGVMPQDCSDAALVSAENVTLFTVMLVSCLRCIVA